MMFFFVLLKTVSWYLRFVIDKDKVVKERIGSIMLVCEGWRVAREYNERIIMMNDRCE
jgi:hypothetical protein